MIEHTTDPIGAIKGAWRKLRPGGSLILVVPEMTRTCDRNRLVAPLSHVVLDHKKPDRVRDQEHFMEFYSLACPTPQGEYEATWRGKGAELFPIYATPSLMKTSAFSWSGCAIMLCRIWPRSGPSPLWTIQRNALSSGMYCASANSLPVPLDYVAGVRA